MWLSITSLILIWIGSIGAFLERFFFENKNKIFRQVIWGLFILGLIGSSISDISSIKIERDVNRIDNNNYYAEYDYKGMKTISGVTTGTNLSQRLSKVLNTEYISPDGMRYVLLEDKDVTLKCLPGDLEIIENIIKDYPSFPFIYHVKAECLRKEGGVGAIGAYEKARDLLRVTTKIQNHFHTHDVKLAEIEYILENHISLQIK